MSDFQGRAGCLGSICGLESQDLAEVTRRSGMSAPVVARKVTDDRGVPGTVLPGQWKRILLELVAVRNVEGRSQCRLFADLVWSEDLGDLHNLGLIGLQIGDRDHAVACAKVDAETELGAHWSLELLSARTSEITR